MEQWVIQIDRANIARAAIVALAPPQLMPGETEFRLDLAAMTANNVTYAALGKPGGPLGADVGYWDFFTDRRAAGLLPVWGFASVTRSRAPGLARGERFYGYWPLASHTIMQPERISPVGFTDGTLRRRMLPAFYNNYQCVAALDDHEEADHELWPIWRPLRITGWLIADQLGDQDDYGAVQVLVTAASSKTALGFAAAMRRREQTPHMIGLTSRQNQAFVRGTGLYDAVVSYDDLDGIAARAATIIDFASNRTVTEGLHRMLGDALRLDLAVGFTHWNASTVRTTQMNVPQLPFFAPARITKRVRDWGSAGLRAQMGAAWRDFMPLARRLTRLDAASGAAGALTAYEAAVSGTADPAVATLLRP